MKKRFLPCKKGSRFKSGRVPQHLRHESGGGSRPLTPPPSPTPMVQLPKKSRESLKIPGKQLEKIFDNIFKKFQKSP